jgi:hypothetical protein
MSGDHERYSWMGNDLVDLSATGAIFFENEYRRRLRKSKRKDNQPTITDITIQPPSFLPSFEIK